LVDNVCSGNPGEMLVEPGELVLNEGYSKQSIKVTNMGDRPIQVGSHFHFFECNAFLQFNREKAYGMRLNIPSGMACRFEPGESKQIELVQIAGERIVWGGNAMVCGALSPENLKSSLDKIKKENFYHVKD